jgi:Transglycosylase
LRQWLRRHRRLSLVLAAAVAILARHGGRALAPPPPQRLAIAVVSTEDENFYGDIFFNVASGAGRAAVAAVGTSEDQGGSTIPQQLAKQLYPHGDGVAGTLEEIGLGVKLSLAYSHEQVLTMYLTRSTTATATGAPWQPPTATSASHRAGSPGVRPRCWRACRRHPAPMTRFAISRSLACANGTCSISWSSTGT